MSRLGKQPIALPGGVNAVVNNGKLSLSGPAGNLDVVLPPGVEVSNGKDSLTVACVDKAMHGLGWALVRNSVVGVTKPYVVDLELHGVGYQAVMEKGELVLTVGFANRVRLAPPKGISVACSDATHVRVTGCDKHAVGQFSANVRRVRPPEPYKGKGIRYTGETVRRKAGKAFGAK